ncbi:LysM peptidoglycan-binding domain-containing protein [Brevibacillus porteri]|uniref:Peptidoglycan-binding protein LysM n=1 Tax=Brevibacillus porteri TaxID=2126350 RepID=A0ABX5FUW0_9BACL|nr:LysM peptidoglycan-binding domain-containing protein [Brevibacillus porteri]MED1798995.1 LysM peptidoglycan-binding domain-containing protein [Brevibacillus porteri]MED2130097.1 LysM peptidoglycan-binding domain-containing protein [Brevibacillus porteri]MED2746545.1 LysM peptidoglycan-binding domain-containing protein [Brevibacillus porteri]MED2814616.1 LysM peptidoglycan-binding domain-containing protein [Brevibacillus porteri]MED2894625.1 LysM peptidoglycan-binding domain-containing prote
MALQDGQLSFAIKETIFLSSDRAGIGELQELELVPDVEVLENDSYISITGCLQLVGKYEPIREAAEATGGERESLVEAMTFTPFRQEASDQAFYGWEEQIGHRIPLNITIPLDRITEIGDIYAIVDSFDYKLESPHQMLIDADLKILGIVLGDRAEQAEQIETQAAGPGEGAWEYTFAAGDDGQEYTEQTSLDDIDQKLSALEEELERQALPASYESTESPSMFDTPAIAQSDEDEYYEQYGDVLEVAQSNPPESWETASISYDLDSQQSASYDSSVAYSEQSVLADEQEQMREIAEKEQEHEEPVLAIHDQQAIAYQQVSNESTGASVEAESQEAVQEAVEATVVSEQEPEQEAEPVVAQPEAAAEDVEVRVAISGKPSYEERSRVNITSIFSQANRAKQEAMALEAESSSSSSRHGSSGNVNASTMEAMQNLTSFVRRKEERSSQLKMCIIQRDETLEHISQRYSLPVSKIVEVNRLASEQLVAGQILYIPQ